MEVNGQFHAPTALPLGKEPSLLIWLEVAWAAEPDWTVWNKESLAPAGNRAPAIQPVARRCTVLREIWS
jgi:hypothetical protein